MAVVTIGFFDGVHLGHVGVLNALKESSSDGREASVVTFWPHPRVVLQQDAMQFHLLTSMDEKRQLIVQKGISDFRVMEFTKDFASMTAEMFLRRHIIDRMGCDTLVLGYDNRMGSDSLPTSQVALLGEKLGLKVIVVPPYELDGVRVSSTVIRNCLMAGDVQRANSMLGYSYKIDGTVVMGNQIGRTLGFPTANMRPGFPLKLIPANGVYLTEAKVNGKVYNAMTNVGIRPTIARSTERIIETNIFDFDEDIYGMEMEVKFLKRIREERCFPGLSELKKQLALDSEACREELRKIKN